jgi:hypothetical protein
VGWTHVTCDPVVQQPNPVVTIKNLQLLQIYVGFLEQLSDFHHSDGFLWDFLVGFIVVCFVTDLVFLWLLLGLFVSYLWFKYP